MRARIVPDPRSGRVLRGLALLSFALCGAVAFFDVRGCAPPAIRAGR